MKLRRSDFPERRRFPECLAAEELSVPLTLVFPASWGEPFPELDDCR